MRPKLPPPPLPPGCTVQYVKQRERHKRWDSDGGPSPTKRIFHCVKRGCSAALCGVDPTVIPPVLRKRATFFEPEIWRKKTWSMGEFHTEITCATCRAMIRKALDKQNRAQIRYRPHGIKERPTKPKRDELLYAKNDGWDADREPWLDLDATPAKPPKETTMSSNFMSLPKRHAPKPVAEIPVPVHVAVEKPVKQAITD